MTYRYPDFSDRITATFIGEHELYPGYWEESEKTALALAGIKLADEGKAAEALDAGCGEGRLLPWLGKYAAKITAIEPDAKRLAIATETFPQVNFEQASIEDHKGKYDLILCSHILQHMPTDAVQPTLEKLHDLTKPDGTLVLLYSRAPFDREEYSLESLKGQKTRSQKIDEHRFNKTLQEDPGDILPVHYFNPNTLRKEAERMGWQEAMRWTFHVTDEIYKGKNPDAIVNGDPELRQKFGRDMLVLWQRTNKNRAA